MISFLQINLLLSVFLFLSIFENNIKLYFKGGNKFVVKISSPILLIIISILFLSILFFVIFAAKDLVYWYLVLSFIFLMFGHVIWLSAGRELKIKTLIILSGVLIILLRFLFSSTLTHNLFIVTSFIWVGPFFIQTKLLNPKRFIIISLIWFFYDIIFVWLTPAASELVKRTSEIDFPLALKIDNSFLGTGDLLWACFFLSILKNTKQRFLAVAILIGSNLGFGVVEYATNNRSIFPLLTMWVPLGIIYLKVLQESRVLHVPRA